VVLRCLRGPPVGQLGGGTPVLQDGEGHVVRVLGLERGELGLLQLFAGHRDDALDIRDESRCGRGVVLRTPDLVGGGDVRGAGRSGCGGGQ
jgi:hypothetical protein